MGRRGSSISLMLVGFLVANVALGSGVTRPCCPEQPIEKMMQSFLRAMKVGDEDVVRGLVRPPGKEMADSLFEGGWLLDYRILETRPFDAGEFPALREYERVCQVVVAQKHKHPGADGDWWLVAYYVTPLPEGWSVLEWGAFGSP